MFAQTDTIQLEASWRAQLLEEFSQPYMQDLNVFLMQEKAAKKRIYPKEEDVFNAFRFASYKDVNVVILGQDPYHGAGQAHGLSFSVPPGVAIPPSLRNIYRELQQDLGIAPVQHGCLESWAKQGVLLLNSVLTVEHGLAASHQGKGWERFTDGVIERLNALQTPVIFVLWGSYAQKKGHYIDTARHDVLRAPHPSPLSASRGFFGSRPFSNINALLKKQGKAPIDWQLPQM